MSEKSQCLKHLFLANCIILIMQNTNVDFYDAACF